MSEPLPVKLTNADRDGNRWTPDHTTCVTPILVSGQARPLGYDIADRLDLRQASESTLFKACQRIAEWQAARESRRLAWGDWRGNRNVGWSATARGRLGPVEVWVAGIPRDDYCASGMYDIQIGTPANSYAWVVPYPHLDHRRAYAIAHAEALHSKE